MDEYSTGALHYGHLGRAIYQPETRAWTFSRTLARSPLFVYTGVTKTSIVSPLTAPQSSLIENKSLLPWVHPELAACWPLVDNETVSHVITTAGELCDPLVSSLFDLGNAVDIENSESGNRVVPIAITVGGECCNVISFRKMEEGTAELKHGMRARIRVPVVGDTECTEWSAGGAPVRQICFARTVEEKSTWAAARFPHSTIVFRPLYRRKPVSVHIYQDGDRVVPSHTQSSRLDANPLVEIPHSQTGGYAHSDVTFNPWYQKQLAIVDERGNWSVWEMVGHRRSKGNWTAARVKSGSLPWLDLGHTQNINGSPRHDGWAVVEWVGDVNSFIVSDRRCPILYRTEGNEILPFAIELELKRKSEWILDVKRSACNVSQVFILTTSRIFWLDVSSVLVADSQKDASRPSLLPLLSWRHFRDSEDTTLRLSSLVVSEELYLVLYSRLNHVVLAYQVPNASDGYMHLTSISDPFVLEMPPVSEESAETQISPNAAQFSTLVLREIAHAPSAGSKEQYDATAKIIKLFTLDSRLAVRESIYIGPGRGTEANAEQQLGKDALRLRKRYPGVRRMQTTRSRDDFVVDDWDKSVMSRGTFTVADTGISHITPLATPQWTTDYSSVYAIAFGKIIAGSSEVVKEQDRGFQESIKELKDKLASADLIDLPSSKTMLEVLAGSPLLDDIDQNAHDYDEFLDEFLAPIMSRNHLASVQPAVFPHQSLNLFGSSKVKLVDIYDRLVNDWLSTLQQDIPGRTRIMRERVIRKVAAELALAQPILQRKPLNEAGILRSTEQVNHEAIDDSSPVPVNPPPSLEIGRQRLSLPREISNDYALEPAVGKTTNQNNLQAEEQEVSKGPNGTEPVYCGLASLTTFHIQRPPSGAVATLLSHWQVGSDPATYNWQRIVQTLEEEDLQRASKATTPKRRLRKKASQSTPLNSSQLPLVSSNVPATREWGSQPEVGEPSRMFRLQSSQAMEEDLPMTQAERGTFGGREASRKTLLKARKKKRAAGF